MSRSSAFRTFIREGLFSVAHEALLMGLRCESLLNEWRTGPKRLRVIATACYTFPVYSQTFVYREVAELARGGFNVRFVYSEATSNEKPGGAALQIWPLRRRLILRDGIAERDMRYYMRRMPEQFAGLVRLIAEASDLTPDQIKANRHFRQAFSFTRAVECWKAQYLHSYFFYERTLFALVASHLLQIPRGVSCYADHVLDDYALKLVPLHMTTCAVAVATSARIKAELEALAGRPLPHAIVKPNAIDVRQFEAHRRDLNADRPVNVVAVCRIHPKKGLTYLVDAALQLRENGLRVVTRIVGEPDSDESSEACFRELKDQIAAHRLEAAVSLEGRRNSDEVREYLAAADIFVSPFIELPNGDKDGIPTALLEAMAAGCAIVTTDAGSILEVVDHEREGLIVPQRDPTALASAIRRLIADHELSERISGEAIRRVRRQFDSNHAEDIFHARVREALAPNEAHPVVGLRPQ